MRGPAAPNIWIDRATSAARQVVAWDTGNDEQGACAGSRTSALYHRLLLGWSAAGLRFGSFRVRCQGAAAAVPVTCPTGTFIKAHAALVNGSQLDLTLLDVWQHFYTRPPPRVGR